VAVRVDQTPRLRRFQRPLHVAYRVDRVHELTPARAIPAANSGCTASLVPGVSA
jgi:hypothetical protein